MHKLFIFHLLRTQNSLLFSFSCFAIHRHILQLTFHFSLLLLFFPKCCIFFLWSTLAISLAIVLQWVLIIKFQHGIDSFGKCCICCSFGLSLSLSLSPHVSSFLVYLIMLNTLMSETNIHSSALNERALTFQSNKSLWRIMRSLT